MLNEFGQEVIAAAPVAVASRGRLYADAVQIARAASGLYALLAVKQDGRSKLIAWLSPAALDVMIVDLGLHRDALLDSARSRAG